jgi:hypothetical protein
VWQYLAMYSLPIGGVIVIGCFGLACRMMDRTQSSAISRSAGQPSAGAVRESLTPAVPPRSGARPL